jgi:hypothetical protein
MEVSLVEMKTLRQARRPPTGWQASGARTVDLGLHCHNLDVAFGRSTLIVLGRCRLFRVAAAVIGGQDTDPAGWRAR